MKLAGAAAAKFFARPEPDRAGVLIFGADAMRVARGWLGMGRAGCCDPQDRWELEGLLAFDAAFSRFSVTRN